MAYTPANYTGNGVTTDFTFTFPYILPAHVVVKVNGVVVTTYTFLTTQTIRFNVAPANGAAINITRSTTNTDLPGTFQQGASIPAETLNANFNQNLYVNQESSLLVLETTNLANQTISDSQQAASDAAAAVVTANNASNTAAAAVVTANGAVATANGAVSTANGATGVANAASSTAADAVATANAASAAVAGVTLATQVANRAALEALTPVNNTVYEVVDSTNLQGSAVCQGIPGGFVGSNLLSMRLQYQSGPAKFVYQTYAAKDPEAQYAAKSTETTAATGVANAATAQSAANAAQSTANTANSTANTAASNIQLLTAQVGTDGNLLLNGDMRFSTRFAGVATADAQIVDTTFVCDRWRQYSTQASKIYTQQLAQAPEGFGFSMRVGCGVTATVGTGDQFLTSQNLWANDLGGLLWGTANARTLYLTFKARSNTTGNHSFGVRVGTFPGPYLSRTFLYNIPVANVWTDIAITIPGPTAVGALWQDIKLLWSLAGGSTFTLAPGTWTAGNTPFATGAVNLMGNTSNYIDLTAVQLTDTSLTIPFIRRHVATERALLDAYQHYTSIFAIVGAPIGFFAGYRYNFRSQMRATPSVADTDLGGYNWDSYSATPSTTQIQFSGTVGSGAPTCSINRSINAVVID